MSKRRMPRKYPKSRLRTVTNPSQLTNADIDEPPRVSWRPFGLSAGR